MYNTWLYILGVSTPISKTGNLTNQVTGVSIPLPSERKLCVPYVVGVGSAIPFQEVESFSYALCIIGVATSTQFLNFYARSMGVCTSMMYSKGNLLYKKKTRVYGHP